MRDDALSFRGHGYRLRCILRRRVLLSALTLGSACAPAAPPAALTQTEVAALEARVSAAPGDTDAKVRLARAYQQTGRPADAARVLEPVVVAQPRLAMGVLVLGITYEDLGRLKEARDLYERYLAQTRSGGLTDEVRARISLIRRKELEAAVKTALQQERTLSTAPAARSVAVFPFVFSGGDPELRPLSRALAEMLTNDLSQTGRFTVLERLHVQLLLNEIALSESGAVSPETVVKGGRILGAGRIVQGQVEGTEAALRLQAAVVDASTAGTIVGRAEGQDALRRLFDLEKKMALDIYAAMGVQLTTAEIARVNRKPTDNIQAILAYGRGLEAGDAGNYSQAAREFEQAARLDGGFAAAREGAARARGLATAAATSTAQLGQRAGAPADASSIAAIQAIVPTSVTRDAAPEVLGSEGLGKRTILEILIRRN